MLFTATGLLTPLPPTAQYFAVKKLNCNKAVFQQEVRMLKRLIHQDNEHVISLQSTYRHLGHFHLVFPWGECNLRDYWREKHPAPLRDDTVVSWMVAQCGGIAEGLSLIHHHWTNSESSLFNCPTPHSLGHVRVATGSGRGGHNGPSSLKRLSLSQVQQPARPPGSPSSPVTRPPLRVLERGLSAGHVPAVSQQRVVWGVHGDIKPSNLLWFPSSGGDKGGMGTIKVADFGSGEFRLSARTSTASSVHSPAYRPPEYDLPNPERVSPYSYDVWSLGCVYLEFVTWYVGGRKLLEELDRLRGANSQGGQDETRALFEIVAPHEPVREAIVKPAVGEVCRPFLLPLCRTSD